MSGSFPNSMNLTTKPAAVPARSYRTNISPINGSIFQPGSTIKIDIPSGGNIFLDGKQSYLKISFKNKSANPTFLNGSILGVIQRLEIYHGGQLLETIDQYNVLAQAFLDSQSAPSWQSGVGACTWGSSGDKMKGDTVEANSVETYSVPIMSGIIGAHLSKYLPLSMLDSAPIRVEITLASVKGGAHTGDLTHVPDWEIHDVEYVAQLTELSSDSMRMLRSALGNTVEISSESFRNYNYVIQNAQASVSELIPCKFSSVKGLYTTFRKATDIVANNQSACKRILPVSVANGDSMTSQYRIGSMNVPQKPVRGVREHCSEIMKSFHAVSDIHGGGQLSHSNYKEDLFFMGQELESFAHSSDVLESGVNTLSQNCYIDLNLAGNAVAEMRMDVWAHYDQFLVIENGLSSVRF